MLHEFKAGLEHYLRHEAAPRATAAHLAELVAFNGARGRTSSFFGQDTLLLASSVGGLDDPAYLEARARNWQRARRDGIDAALGARAWTRSPSRRWGRPGSSTT